MVAAKYDANHFVNNAEVPDTDKDVANAAGDEYMKNIIGLLVFAACAFVMNIAMGWITDKEIRKKILEGMREGLA
jgi:hypothetical protein